MSTVIVDALRLGDWNQQVLTLITESLEAGIRFRHIPSINGHVEWNEEDYRDLLGEFMARGRGPARMVQLAVKATDDEHLGRLLNVTVRNFLTDLAREDPLPKLYRTLRPIVASMPDVVADKVHACCTSCVDREPWQREKNDEPLLSAAKQVNVAPPVYGEKAEREGPPTDRDSFERLCRAILEVAQCPVPMFTLTRVVAQRLQIRYRWDDGLPEKRESLRPLVASTTPISPLAFVFATGIWEQLDDDQRRLLPFLDEGGRAASAESGISLGKSAAQVRIDKLKAHLGVTLEDVDDQVGVIGALLSFYGSWMEKPGNR